MAVFVVLAANDDSKLASRITTAFPTDHFHIADRQWLVAADMTAKQLSDKLGITGGDAGSSIFVGSVSSYYGRHRNDLWEWLKIKLEAGAGG